MKNTKLFSVIILALLLIPASLFAQQTIRGQIINGHTGSPVAHAFIGIEGSAITIQADKQGLFTINAGLPAILVVYSPGYDTAKLAVNQSGTFQHISLKPAAHVLNEVDITATSGKDRSPLYQPAAISKLGTRELKRGDGLFLRDAINQNVPGVYMESRSAAGGQQINIRGYGNGHGFKGVTNNFDGQGVKVYYNGIPITDAEGITILDDIDFYSLGNAEIIKGPSGTLYGSAIAGVVNLNTVTPEAGAFSIGQEAFFGSYGLSRLTTHLALGGKSASLLVNYGHQHASGFMDKHSMSRKDFVNVSANITPSEKESFQAYFGYTKSYDQRAGELTIEQYENKDYSGNPDYIKNDAHSAISGFHAGLSHTDAFSRHIANTSTVFASANSNHSSSAAGWTDKTL
ncbi:MAG TPA: TonB-dependent receptor plug domain-containing protein [Edaphocola sp.]|nr:TonB-dependent receptor plug domain-containing protein [Edaphocola sp.]